VNRELFRKAHIISPSKWLIEYSRKVGIKSVMTHIPPAVKLGQDKKRYEKEIIWVGRIEEPKGLAEVLSTLVDCGRLHQWKVTIVGDGPDRKILEKKYPYAEFTGAVDPLKYYQRASILVVSSIQPETGPLVLLEGMAYGLCVIGYGIGGVPEIVCDNSDGILYLSREDLAEKLSNLVVDRSRIEEVGRLAVKKVERCYGWDKCVERHLNVYRAGIGNLIT
jgi:glycosyltransferase involved in cell wall biosynthesis